MPTIDILDLLEEFTYGVYREYMDLYLLGDIKTYPQYTPIQYSDILKKKKKHAKKPNTKGFVVRPKMYARQRR